MALNTHAKKSVAALALVFPLTLAACGDDNEGDSTDAANTVTSTASAESSKSASSSAPQSSASDSAKTSQGSDASSSDAKSAGGDAAAAQETLAEPFAGENNPMENATPLAPVADGQDADPATAGQIDGLVRGLYNTKTMHQFMRYMPDHTCTRILDQKPELRNMDLSQIPDVALADIPDSQWGSVNLKSVSDIKVKGNEASAQVAVDSAQGLDSQVMRFENENGNWLFCGEPGQ